MKKILKSKIIQYNLENLLNCTFNLIINFNGGQPMTVNQKKRMLNIIISNFQGFEKEEVKSCNIMVNETKNVSSQKNGDKSNFADKKLIVPEENTILIGNNNLKNNDNLEDKKNDQENKTEFCNKKRKNSSLVKKIFQINKVIKYKYSNNFNKINENSNKQIYGKLKKSKTKKSQNKIESRNKFNHNIIYPIINESYNFNLNKNSTNNFNNLICNISINNDMRNISINFNNTENMNSFTNNNFNTNNNNNINVDMNTFNLSETLFDFGTRIDRINSFDKFPDGVGLNDSLKSIFFEESNISLGEQDNDASIINKKYDLFE
jgi:hypothetical protein